MASGNRAWCEFACQTVTLRKLDRPNMATCETLCRICRVGSAVKYHSVADEYVKTNHNCRFGVIECDGN